MKEAISDLLAASLPPAGEAGTLPMQMLHSVRQGHMGDVFELLWVNVWNNIFWSLLILFSASWY